MTDDTDDALETDDTDGRFERADAHDLPAAIGDRLRETFGFDRAPETFGEWFERMEATFETNLDRELGPADLCTVGSSRHEARVDGERYHYQCVLDAFILGHHLPEPVTVRTVPPGSGAALVVEFGADGVADVPPGAVMSYGVDREAERPPGRITPERLYGQLCGYSHAFPSREAYETWAASTPEAVTTALPLAAGIEIAGEAADVLAP